MNVVHSVFVLFVLLFGFGWWLIGIGFPFWLWHEHSPTFNKHVHVSNKSIFWKIIFLLWLQLLQVMFFPQFFLQQIRSKTKWIDRLFQTYTYTYTCTYTHTLSLTIHTFSLVNVDWSIVFEWYRLFTLICIVFSWVLHMKDLSWALESHWLWKLLQKRQVNHLQVSNKNTTNSVILDSLLR